MNKYFRNLGVVVLCGIGISTGSKCLAQGDITAFTPTDMTPNAGGVGNDGLLFTPTTDISVTSLGYVAGFSVGHDVGLYDVSTSTLLASTTITDFSTPSGGFFYNLITPVSLTAGHEYAVVGNFPTLGDPNYQVPYASMGAAAEITFNGYLYDYSPPWICPQFHMPPPTSAPISNIMIPLTSSPLRSRAHYKSAAWVWRRWHLSTVCAARGD
jgi:hypothetical protein